MFTVDFDTVQSSPGQETLDSFPPRSALPAPASPLTSEDLDRVIKGAVKVGVKLAQAFKDRTPPINASGTPVATGPAELLSKVRGLYGDRLHCVCREIRVLRQAHAEFDSSLLLSQLKEVDASVAATTGERWCLLLGACGESIVICRLPGSGAGGAGGAVLLFNPSARPSLGLDAAYVRSFSSIRAVQLHAVEALTYIWRTTTISNNDYQGDAGAVVALSEGQPMDKEFVALSLLVSAASGSDGSGSALRDVLSERIHAIRKVEKAAAIRAKRREIEALKIQLRGSLTENGTRSNVKEAAPNGETLFVTITSPEVQEGSSPAAIRQSLLSKAAKISNSTPPTRPQPAPKSPFIAPQSPLKSPMPPFISINKGVANAVVGLRSGPNSLNSKLLSQPPSVEELAASIPSEGFPITGDVAPFDRALLRSTEENLGDYAMRAYAALRNLALVEGAAGGGNSSGVASSYDAVHNVNDGFNAGDSGADSAAAASRRRWPHTRTLSNRAEGGVVSQSIALDGRPGTTPAIVGRHGDLNGSRQHYAEANDVRPLNNRNNRAATAELLRSSTNSNNDTSSSMNGTSKGGIDFTPVQPLRLTSQLYAGAEVLDFEAESEDVDALAVGSSNNGRHPSIQVVPVWDDDRRHDEEGTLSNPNPTVTVPTAVPSSSRPRSPISSSQQLGNSLSPPPPAVNGSSRFARGFFLDGDGLTTWGRRDSEAEGTSEGGDSGYSPKVAVVRGSSGARQSTLSSSRIGGNVSAGRGAVAASIDNDDSSTGSNAKQRRRPKSVGWSSREGSTLKPTPPVDSNVAPSVTAAGAARVGSSGRVRKGRGEGDGEAVWKSRDAWSALGLEVDDSKNTSDNAALNGDDELRQHTRIFGAVEPVLPMSRDTLLLRMEVQKARELIEHQNSVRGQQATSARAMAGVEALKRMNVVNVNNGAGRDIDVNAYAQPPPPPPTAAETAVSYSKRQRPRSRSERIDSKVAQDERVGASSSRENLKPVSEQQQFTEEEVVGGRNDIAAGASLAHGVSDEIDKGYAARDESTDDVNCWPSHDHDSSNQHDDAQPRVEEQIHNEHITDYAERRSPTKAIRYGGAYVDPNNNKEEQIFDDSVDGLQAPPPRRGPQRRQWSRVPQPYKYQQQQQQQPAQDVDMYVDEELEREDAPKYESRWSRGDPSSRKELYNEHAPYSEPYEQPYEPYYQPQEPEYNEDLDYKAYGEDYGNGYDGMYDDDTNMMRPQDDSLEGIGEVASAYDRQPARFNQVQAPAPYEDPAKKEPMSFEISVRSSGEKGVSTSVARERREKLERVRAKKVADMENRRLAREEQSAAKRSERARAAAAERLTPAAPSPTPWGAGDAQYQPQPRSQSPHMQIQNNVPQPHVNNVNRRAVGSRISPIAQSNIDIANAAYNRGAGPLPSPSPMANQPPVPMPMPLSARRQSSVPAAVGGSNRRLIRNAVIHLCLAGAHLEQQKAKCLEVLDAHPAPSFVLLIQNKSLAFKALYAYWQDEKRTEKIFGVGPVHLEEAPVQCYYKYDSAAKEFRAVHSRSLSNMTDAVSMEALKPRVRRKSQG